MLSSILLGESKGTMIQKPEFETPFGIKHHHTPTFLSQRSVRNLNSNYNQYDDDAAAPMNDDRTPLGPHSNLATTTS